MYKNGKAPYQLKMASTHAAKLEQWLGKECLENLCKAMKGYYWHIPVGNVPGNVLAYNGDFYGEIRGGSGFSSLSDLINESTGGKQRKAYFAKVGSTGVIGVTNSLWKTGNSPPSGTNASNAPLGNIVSGTSTGAIPLDFVAPDTRHLVGAGAMASVAGNNLLLYDRLWQVNKIMTGTFVESITGAPSRYQSTTGTAQDYAGGNFLFFEVGGVALPATAHNWVSGTYVNQAGTAGQRLPTLTGNASAIVNRLDHPTNQWYAPLFGTDVGIKELDTIALSAAVASGEINIVIGHPLAWMPCPIANLWIPFDLVGTTFNLARIFDDAALAFLEVGKPATGATSYNMELTMVSG